MIVRLHSAALHDLQQAANYCEFQQVDLGKRFVRAMRDAAARISDMPKSHPVLNVDTVNVAAGLFGKNQN